MSSSTVHPCDIAGAGAPPAPGRRSTLRSVALPTEHGGWGLTLEPVLLGLLLRWSGAGLCLGVAAFVAFMARTPLKVVLVDARRRRVLPRTRVAQRVLAAEAMLLSLLVAAALVLEASAFWMPLVVIVPLVLVELWFDMRSRGRRLVPELVGAIGMGGVVAVIVLAGDGSGRLAVACWMILAARAVTAIVAVRDQVGRLHGRPGTPRPVLAPDLTAVAITACAPVVDQSTTVGAIAVVVAIAIQRGLNVRPSPRAVVIGVRQTLLGLVVVAATATGVLWA